VSNESRGYSSGGDFATPPARPLRRGARACLDTFLDTSSIFQGLSRNVGCPMNSQKKPEFLEDLRI